MYHSVPEDFGGVGFVQGCIRVPKTGYEVFKGFVRVCKGFIMWVVL